MPGAETRRRAASIAALAARFELIAQAEYAQAPGELWESHAKCFSSR